MVEICSQNFCISQIADSGQCFRITMVSLGVWEVVARGKRLIVRQKQKQPQKELAREENRDGREFIHVFECSPKEYDAVWYDYFDMSRNYAAIKNRIISLGDPYLTRAVNFGYGIHILHQDPWETLISFIISQRNNINRIRKIIKNLCMPYGDRFPSSTELSEYSEKDFLKMGLGYRARYVRNAVLAINSGCLNLEQLQHLCCEEVIKKLKGLDGVGDKVANCVALFGFQKIEAFPIDVWIMKILNREYGGLAKDVLCDKPGSYRSYDGRKRGFNLSNFFGYSGIVQQYMFYYERFRKK